MRVRIKICGITDPSQAADAAAAGADALGLMFYAPSRRHLDIDQAANICRNVSPFVSKIGVMVNPDEEYVRGILERVPLTHLQFHGEEPADFCASFGLPYIKGIRVADQTDLLSCESEYDSASGILLDTFVSGEHGGTGKTFDWNRARYRGKKPVILAGGLNADNVCQAIETAQPFAVDVSSGVETNRQKDPSKMIAFCQRVLGYHSMLGINTESG